MKKVQLAAYSHLNGGSVILRKFDRNYVTYVDFDRMTNHLPAPN